MNLTSQQKQALIIAYPELASYFTQESNNETLNQVASRSKLPSELIAKIKAIRGDKGEAGRDGHTPMHIGNEEPINPKKGDLWYQD